MKKLLLVSLMLFSLVLAGCSISFSNSKISDGGIFASLDYGQTWAQKVFVRQEKKQRITISNVDVAGVFLSPFSGQELVITTRANGIFVSEDGGDVWQAVPLPAGNYPTFAFDPKDPAILYTATGRTVLKSGDGGSTWDTIYTDARGEAITALAVDPYDPSNIVAATGGGTVLKSLNYGNDWSVKFAAGDPVRRLFFRADDSRILYLVTANKGLVRSLDGGDSWTSLLQNLAKFPGAAAIAQITFVPAAPATFYIATNYGLLKSIDGGDTWAAVKTLIPFGSVPLRTVALDPYNQQIIYFTTNNLLHKSEDGGATWRTIETIPTSRLIVHLLSLPKTPGSLLLGTLKLKK